eukprot:1789622-Prymnesium_polylepis.1
MRPPCNEMCSLPTAAARGRFGPPRTRPDARRTSPTPPRRTPDRHDSAHCGSRATQDAPCGDARATADGDAATPVRRRALAHTTR